MSETQTGTVEDVRRFLSDLKVELPEVFRAPQTPKNAILERVAYWAEKMEARHRRVFVRDQRTRWGSCSAQGNLNFNWRLTMAPPEILDYVVVHELAHLAELNHSKRFWAHVARWCPDYKERRRWLRKNGAGLLKLSKPGTND